MSGLVAVERIFSQGVVADLLKEPGEPRAHRNVFLEDLRPADHRVHRRGPGVQPGSVRRMAVEYFADESYLAEVAEAEREDPSARAKKRLRLSSKSMAADCAEFGRSGASSAARRR